jgi:hypothetical protein
MQSLTSPDVWRAYGNKTAGKEDGSAGQFCAPASR